MRANFPLNIPTLLVVAWWVGVAHVIAGLSILYEPHAFLVSWLAGFRWIMSIYSAGSWLGGTLLIIVGCCAVFGGTMSLPFEDYQRLKLIAPQVVLLIFSVTSIIIAIVAGRYPDGYSPTGGSAFILVDQLVVVIVGIVHVASVLAIPLKVSA